MSDTIGSSGSIFSSNFDINTIVGGIKDGSIISTLLFGKRRIGEIIPGLVTEEQHTDETTITDHPVEKTAPISDHAFAQPAKLVMRCSWSTAQIEAFGNFNYVQEVYERLIALRNTFEPFDVVTGKRTYHNMMFQVISVSTDRRSENALIVTAYLREVIITQTQTTQTAPMAAQQTPDSTAATQQGGSVQPQAPATPQQNQSVYARLNSATGNLLGSNVTNNAAVPTVNTPYQQLLSRIKAGTN